MIDVGTFFQIFGGFLGVLSAYFWWRAAVIQPTPPHVGGFYLPGASPNPNAAWKAAWDQSAKLNAKAAVVTGLAALLAGVGTILVSFLAQPTPE